jgi:hypothetical protein
MRSTIYFTAAFIFLLSVSFTLSKSSDNVKLGKHYGPVTVDTSKAISPAEMMTKFTKDVKEMDVTLSTPISKVCQNAGCWISIDKGNGEQLRVRFKDHFTIPIKTKIGTKAYLHGVASWVTISVEMQKHFAEDAKMSAEEIAKITEPKFEMGFTADGIVLVK